MATQLPMTLQDIQDAIHVLTSSDPTTPATTDDQWNTRLQLINRAIATWERQDVEWRELMGTWTEATTITAGQQAYPITATAFRMLGSLVKVTLPAGGATQYVDVIRPADRVQWNDQGRYVYLTGNQKDGFTLNFGWMLLTGDPLIGATMTYDYYKSADRMAVPSDTTRMSNPDYIVFWAAAHELLYSGMNNLGQTYLAEADDLMRLMKVQNEMTPAYASREIPDISAVRYVDSWGE